MTLPTNGYGRVNEEFRTLDTGLSYKNICLLSTLFIFYIIRHCPIEPLHLCPLLFLLFVYDLADDLETLTLLFADDVTRRSQRMNLHNSLTAAWDWSKKWDLPINKCNYLTIGREVPLRLSFFPDGSGAPIPVSTLVKDLGVQTDNMFSPSAQCTEAANNARRLIFMIRCSFQDLKIGFHPFMRGLSVSATQIWYVSLFAKPGCRYQPSRANSKISHTVGSWHASPFLRRETAATGPSFAAAATTSR